MTRPTQKQEEHDALRNLLAAIGVLPESFSEGEAPDFIIQISGQSVGIEVTMYQSRQIIAGVQKRAVEAEWEAFKKASVKFQDEHDDLKGIYILLRFKSILPPKQEHAAFRDEMLLFLRSVQGSLSTECSKVFFAYELASPLLTKYLTNIAIKRCEHSEWDSNQEYGFVDGRPTDTISRIVLEKSGRTYQPTDEVWLLIQCSHRPSEMGLVINGVSEFDANSDLQKNLTASLFSRVYAFTPNGLFQWDKRSGNWQLATDARLK